jgi:hypothetical protein
MKNISWLFKISPHLKTVTVGYYNDLVEKAQVVEFSEKLLESGYYEDELEVLAGSELYEEEVFQKIIYSKERKMNLEEKEKEIKKIELAELYEVNSEKESGDKLREKLEKIYVRYNYPVEFSSFSKYSGILLTPEEALRKAIDFLEKWIRNAENKQEM